jgi:hypothetical protein
MNQSNSRFTRGMTARTPSNGENPSLRQIVAAGQIVRKAIIDIAATTTNSGTPIRDTGSS